MGHFSGVCFERCLIGCIEEIIKEKNILLQESFRNITGPQTVRTTYKKGSK